MTLATENEPQPPVAPKSYGECARIGNGYTPVLERLAKARKTQPMKGRQVHTGPCCLEYAGEAAKLGLCQTFESLRDADEAWYCAVNRKTAAYSKCHKQVTDHVKGLKFEKAFASVSNKLDSTKSSEDVIRAAAEWSLARQRYFGAPAEAAPDELEDFRQTVFDEFAGDPVKERRDAALWMLGRQLAKRYPNLAISGAMILEAIGRAAQRIAPLMTVIDALRPSPVATDDQEMTTLDATIQRKIQERLARHLILGPPPRLVPPQTGPVVRGPSTLRP
ncbi:MAG: hypothetical protein E5X67_35780 [Mesorhizobium sp.]|uniref:hypothetical protein n=1 Tax=Mesorhizobium sp. TaxID=1871066 RepID=UPI0011FE500A|nr:hypothetical protein [Mesorhizobium sp.]TIP22829.1 MAG: hypothetical protein E5X67_35780 [Mesorhizobium sp.]